MTFPHNANLKPSRTYGDIRRDGLSLLEVIIATAILAGAGFVLFSIIGLGSKYAQRAETLTFAHHLAQTLLDEAIAQPETIGKDKTETIPEAPQWSYRITSDQLDDPSLHQVTVEVFPTEETYNTSSSRSDTKTTYRLSRWVRIPIPMTERDVLP